MPFSSPTNLSVLTANSRSPPSSWALRGAVDQRPGRPRGGVGAQVGWPRHDLQLRNALGALAVGGPEAVGSGVTTTDDHHVLSCRVDRRRVRIAELHAVGRHQILHRRIDACQLAARHRKVTRNRCAPVAITTASKSERSCSTVEVGADMDAGDEPGAFGLHLRQPPIEVPLLHLELRDAIAQQPADAVGGFVHGHLVAGAGELLSGGQPGRAGADHRDLLPGELTPESAERPSPRPRLGR